MVGTRKRRPKRTVRPRSRAMDRARADGVRHLAAGGTFSCWKCGRIIRNGDQWVVGHRTPWIHGGSDEDTAPECKSCSDREGGTIGHAQWRRNRQRNSDGIDWWGASA